METPLLPECTLTPTEQAAWHAQIDLANDLPAIDAILQSLSGRLHRKHPLLKHAVTKYYDIAARWYAAVSLMSLNAFTGERHLIFSKDKP